MGRDPPRPPGQVGRGPARALHQRGARARPAPAGHRRLRRRRPPARARRQALARQRRLHPLRHHRPDHHLDPAARPLQARDRPLRVLVALHEHRLRDALSGRLRPQGCFAMERTMGHHRRRARSRPGRGAAQLHPPDRDALGPRPSRTAARSSTTRATSRRASPSSRTSSAGTTSPTTAARAWSGGTQGRARDRLLRRGHRRRPLRGGSHPDRDERVGSTSRRALRRRARATRPSSPRSSPRSSASGWRTLSSPRATPARWRMPWAPSRRAPRSAAAPSPSLP